MRRRLLRFGTLLAAGLAVLAYPVAFALDRLAGRDVWMIDPKASEVVALERAQWRAEHAPWATVDAKEVAALYGAPLSRERVLFAAGERVVVPSEAPDLTLLKVEKGRGENPLQAKTAYFLARWTAAVGAVAALAGFALLRLLRPHGA